MLKRKMRLGSKNWTQQEKTQHSTRQVVCHCLMQLVLSKFSVIIVHRLPI